MRGNAVEPIICLNDKWYFLDETWSDHHGPFETEGEARDKLKEYSEGINRPPTVDPSDGDDDNFWDSQFNEAKVGEIIPPTPTEEQVKAAWGKEIIKVPNKVLSLDVPSDLYHLEGLIDAGYLSFIYGSRESNYGGWHNIKMRYANFLLLQDSGGVRSNEFPLYKTGRSERRDKYDYMAATYERVKKFREILTLDPEVNTAKIEGYEADDIIALLFLKGIGKKMVIAQDKDFFMVEGLRQAMVDNNGVPQGQRGLKLPKYAVEPNNPGSWALTQAIFGDKTDSIPRLLPSRSGYKQVYYRLINQASDMLEAFYNCAAEFGDQFETNLRLVLLPHPTLSDEDYDITLLLFQDVCTGNYWNPDNFSDSIVEEVLASIKTGGSDLW